MEAAKTVVGKERRAGHGARLLIEGINACRETDQVSVDLHVPTLGGLKVAAGGWTGRCERVNIGVITSSPSLSCHRGRITH